MTVSQSVASVVVLPAADTLSVGDSLRLVAEARDGNGHPVKGTAFAWSSSDEAVAAVDEGGLVRALATGTPEIAAAYETASGGIAATAAIVVLQPASHADRAALEALYRATGRVRAILRGQPAVVAASATADVARGSLVPGRDLEILFSRGLPLPKPRPPRR